MAVQDLIKSFAPESTKSPECSKRHYARLISALPVALAIVLVSCSAQKIDRRDPTSAGSSLNGETQVITQTDGNNQRVAQVSVPSGALAANQQLSIESGYHTDTAEIHSEFSIGTDTEITPAGVATVVRSNIDSNLASPMTIALDLPVSGAGLLGLFVDRNFFVVYTVRDAQSKTWKRGIIPNDTITVADNKLTFTTKLVGKYEVFQSSKPIDPPKTERIVSEPELVVPPVAVTKVTPLAAKPKQTVTLTGKYFTAKTTVAIGDLTLDTVKVKSSNVLTFTMPELYGLMTVTVAESTNNTATAEIIGLTAKTDRRIIGLTPEQVCSGVSYYDLVGNPKEGSKTCEYRACNKDVDTGCVTNASFPAANKSNIRAVDLKAGKTIAGIAGSLANCNTDGDTDCLSNAAFKALDMTNVTPGNIKNGVTIAGVVGKYPSSEFRLPGYTTSDRVLTGTNFEGMIRQTLLSAEFWDHKGERHVISSTNQLKPENIKNGEEIFGITGTLTEYSEFDPADIRVDVQIGTVTGTLKTDCRNGEKTEVLNGLSKEKTLDDEVLPTEKPWDDKHFCAADIWLAKTNQYDQQGTCSELRESCVWQNATTKTYWGGADRYRSDEGWNSAKTRCESLSAAGKTGWRLPTQKELMSAYAQGAVWRAGNDIKLKVSNPVYWSATSSSSDAAKRYVVNLRTGEVSVKNHISDNTNTICVHD